MRIRMLAPLLLLLLLLLLHSVSAQCPGVTVELQPIAEETLTVGSTAQALTAATYTPQAVQADITIEGGDIRYFVSATPTATLGHRRAATPPSQFTICGLASIQGFRAIRVSTDAILTASYFRRKSP